MSGTAKFGETARGGWEDAPLLAGLSEDIEFAGRSGTYKIFVNGKIASGGESQIYVAQRLNSTDQTLILAKIYRNTPGTAPVSEVTEWILHSENAAAFNILPIYDAGRMMIGESSYNVEIIPYCKPYVEEGGQARRVPYAELRDTVIPGLCRALACLHSAGFVHRDVKPENLYRYGDSILLGDFGTAVRVASYEQQERTAGEAGGRETRDHRGTAGYTAPEVVLGFAGFESDCFSLGCTLAALYCGKHPYAAIIDSHPGSFFNSVEQYGLPLNCPPGEEPLQSLVNALTVSAHVENREKGGVIRAGLREVGQWLKDPESFHKMWKNVHRAGQPGFEINFKETKYRSEEELIHAFLQDWEEAKDFFYGDNLFIEYLKRNQLYGVNVAEKILRNPPADRLGQDREFSVFLHFFHANTDPSGESAAPILWQGWSYSDAAAVVAALPGGSAAECSAVSEMLQADFLSWEMEAVGRYSEGEIDLVKSIESQAKKHPGLALRMLKLLAAPSSPPLSSPDDVVQTYLERGENGEGIQEFIARLLQVMDSGDGAAFDETVDPLIAHGFSQYIASLPERLARTPGRELETAYLFIEELCSDKRALRRHFLEHSPYAPLYWIRQNLDRDLYVFHGSGALAGRIRGCVLNEDTPMRELLGRFDSLRESCADLYGSFQNNMALSAVGELENSTVSSLNSDAFFIPAGELVPGAVMEMLPVGFARRRGYIPPKERIEDAVLTVVGRMSVEDIPAMREIESDSVGYESLLASSGIGPAGRGYAALMREYGRKRFAGGDAVGFAAALERRLLNRAGHLGALLGKTEFGAYHMVDFFLFTDFLVYDFSPPPTGMDGRLRELIDQGIQSEEREYEELLSSGQSLETLWEHAPEDHRPVWRIALAKMRELERLKAPLCAAVKDFDAKVLALETKKVEKIEIRDFDGVIRAAERCEKERAAFASRWRALLEETEPYAREALSLAGRERGAMEKQWSAWIGSAEQLAGRDYRETATQWKRQRWTALGLCPHCGGKISVFAGRCKDCRRTARE